MSWRPHSRARVNPRAPEAWAKCDRCGSVFNLVDLTYQREWAGAKLINKRIKVCSGCLDTPQDQLRLVRLRPDPRPVRDPRPLNNAASMAGYAVMHRIVVPGSFQPPIAIVPGNTVTSYTGPLSDAGRDASKDAYSAGSIYVSGEVGGDSSLDASMDATIASLATRNVALDLLLEVTAPIDDMPTSYRAPALADFYADINTDPNDDAGIDGLAVIPVSIDPPET